MLEMENRCPKGKKTILYYRSKLEKYAEYLNHDGLVCRIIIYTDTASEARMMCVCSLDRVWSSSLVQMFICTVTEVNVMNFCQIS